MAYYQTIPGTLFILGKKLKSPKCREMVTHVIPKILMSPLNWYLEV